MPKIMFKTTHEGAVEEFYTQIKDAARTGNLSANDVKAISELTEELSNRLKVEENG